MSDMIDTLSDEEMVDWANAALERNRELTKRIEELEGEVAKLRNQEIFDKMADEIEQLEDELIATEELAKDRYCTMQTKIEILEAENERLRDALYEIAHMDPIRRIQGDAQKIAKRTLDE